MCTLRAWGGTVLIAARGYRDFILDKLTAADSNGFVKSEE
jgi:hypothetical protein